MHSRIPGQRNLIQQHTNALRAVDELSANAFKNTRAEEFNPTAHQCFEGSG